MRSAHTSIHISILLALLSLTVNAQEKYLSSHFQLLGRVKKVEEITYTYRQADKRYQIEAKRILSFEGGKLVHKIEGEQLLGYTEQTTRYTYDSQQRLLYSIEESSRNKKRNDTFYYEYNNNQLVGKKGWSDGARYKEIYEYNQAGLLSKVSVRLDTALLRSTIYTNRMDAGNYTLTDIGYFRGRMADYVVSRFVNGKEVSSVTQYQFNEQSFQTTYAYDSRGNEIERKAGTALYRNVYTYDDRGNIIQVKLGGNEGGGEATPNRFRFIRITYEDGVITGSTDLKEAFVKLYDKESATYAYEKKDDSLLKALEEWLEEGMEDEIQYLVLKNSDGRFKIKANEEMLTTSVKGIKAPNQLDLLVYDSIMELSVFVKDFYSQAMPVETWIETKFLPYSLSNTYYVFSNNKTGINIISRGRYVDTKNYLFSKVNDGKDLQVSYNGQILYVFKDINGYSDGLFVPVEGIHQK